MKCGSLVKRRLCWLHFVIDYDRSGAEPERLMMVKITFMPDAPILEAATPAAG